MGAASFFFRKALTVTGLAMALALPSAGKARKMDLNQIFDIRFESVAGIMQWAGATVSQKWEFVRDGKQVVVIVSNYTSGLPTSDIVMFDKQPDGRFAIMLIRRRFVGFVSAVKEENDSIVLVAKDPILVIPWTGIISGGEQNR